MQEISAHDGKNAPEVCGQTGQWASMANVKCLVFLLVFLDDLIEREHTC